MRRVLVLYTISLVVLLFVALLAALPVSLLLGGPSSTILGGVLAVFYGLYGIEIALQRASTGDASTATHPDPVAPAAGSAP
jgi:hypothetical protein